MPEIRYWNPGASFVPAIPGETWFINGTDALTVTAVLSGCWGANRNDDGAYGSWDEDAGQVWTVRIPKSAHTPADEEFPEPFWYWRWALDELFDKPHRAIGLGLDHGAFISRVPVPDLPGVRSISLGIVKYATPGDRRAVRLREVAAVKAGVRKRASRRKWRRGTSAMVYQGHNWRGWNRDMRRRRRRLDLRYEAAMKAGGVDG